MPDIRISKLNESFLLATPSDEGVEQTLLQMFSFMVPGCWYHPRFKKGLWDGKIRLYNRRTNTLYIGLKDKLIEKLKEMNVSYHIDDSFDDLNFGIPVKKIEEYLQSLNVDLTPYDHQVDMVKAALFLKRLVAISPTGSGKSFAYYIYIKYLTEKVLKENEQILLVVPTTSLVLQMQSDFIEYDKRYNTIADKIHIIMAGIDKDSKKQITISTWQSIQKGHIEPVYGSMKNYFQRFKVAIFDEFHQYGKAECLIGSAESCINADWRLGATGTTDDWQTHHFVMEGLVGKIYQITKTKTLIEKKILSPIKIFSYIFKYPVEDCELITQIMMSQGDSTKAWQKEIEYIYNHPKRNNAVCKLVSFLKKNTLVLFTRIEHGQYLFKKISKITKGQNKVFYIDGSISAQEREDIRAQMERDSNCIAVASVQVFGVGINIKNLHNIVFAAGSKSKIRVLQAIGRGLRIHESKDRLVVIDIVDDLAFTYTNPSTNKRKTYKNFSLMHHGARISYYKKEAFPFEEKIINMR